jgi:methionyl-tRNA formyltransferase
MKITVFTSNQPRHLALIERLAGVSECVMAVQECTTVFPGQVADFFRKSDVMQRYFGRVIEAERRVFGGSKFTPSGARSLSLKMGDLSLLQPRDLGAAMEADVFVVFGSSFIKGALCAHLAERAAYNIHMGMSPWYRGSSCNFWAMYDGRPEMVGATIHKLTAGLDNGPIYGHAQPPAGECDPFLFGMLAVKAAHDALIDGLSSGRFAHMTPEPQDRSQQIRYTRNADFTDAVAAEYLERIAAAEVTTLQ